VKVVKVCPAIIGWAKCPFSAGVKVVKVVKVAKVIPLHEEGRMTGQVKFAVAKRKASHANNGRRSLILF
jgi:hypothetical protein